jgi:tetratricopeptide (TPR) repeat protein
LAAAQLHLNRGICQQTRKRTAAALKQYRLAEAALGPQPSSPRERVQIELIRSSAFYQMGDLTNAQAALQRAFSIGARLTDDFSSQAFLESSLGRVYFGFGKKKEGKRMLKSAASLWKKAGVPELEIDITGLFQTG